MRLNLIWIMLIQLALVACTQDPDPNNNKNQASSSAPGFADLIIEYAMGPQGQCPGGYNLISSFQINTCHQVGVSTTGQCTVSYCSLAYQPGSKDTVQQYVITDIKFYNYQLNAPTTPTCPKTYQDLMTMNSGASQVYFGYNPTYGGDQITQICVQYEVAPGTSAQLTSFYTNDTNCASGDTSFSGYRWQADTETVQTHYCIRH